MLPSSDALITEGVEKELRGTITSIYSSMRFIGVSLGPPIMSLLMGAGHMVMFICFAGVSLAAVVLILLMVQPESTKGERGDGLKKAKQPRLS
ncbi:Bacillibactin exporter [compost metagenome]